MTSRQYSLFSLSSARAKARREKFAQTRKSLSASWGSDSAGCILELPSPTIGTPPRHLYLLPHAISPLALFTTRAGTATAVHSSSGEDLVGEGGGGGGGPSSGGCCSGGGGGALRRKPTMMPPPVLAGGVRRKHRPCFKRDAPRLAPTKEQPAHLEASASTPINPSFLSSSLSEDGFPGMRERSKSFSDFSKSWEPFVPENNCKPLPAKRTTQPPSRLDLFQMRNSLDQNWICEKCESDATCVLLAAKQNKILPAGKSTILKSGGSGGGVFGDASPPFFRKANTLPEQEKDARILVAMRNADKRREFFARKHTNSAPDRYTGFSDTSTPMAGGTTTTTTGWNENSLAENILDTTRM